MMGRVADVEGVPGVPEIVYVGSASGGVWKTTNGGVTWTPLFDEMDYLSIGDMALEPGNPDVVYVGTGEGNPRNSVSFGNGVYKTTDGGKTWKHLGLADSERITRVLVDPRNPENVYVAALGHIFGPNEERGVFVSRDSGATWEKTLYIDDRHGAADIDIDPREPEPPLRGDVVLRSKALDAPERKRGGRRLQVRRRRPHLEEDRERAFPSSWAASASRSPRAIRGRSTSSPRPTREASTARTTTARASREVHKDPGIVNRGLYYTDLRVDPANSDRVYAVSSSLQVSIDGGKTFEAISPNTHVDYHSLWIDPQNPKRMWQGEDGGVAVSHDQGKTWEYENNIVLAQFYQIYADNREPFYYLGGGLQDNGTWTGPEPHPRALRDPRTTTGGW